MDFLECRLLPLSSDRMLICFFTCIEPGGDRECPLPLLNPLLERAKPLLVEGRVLIPVGMTANPGLAFFCLWLSLWPLWLDNPKSLLTLLAFFMNDRMLWEAMLLSPSSLSLDAWRLGRMWWPDLVERPLRVL